MNGKGIVKRLKKKHFNASSKHGRKGPGYRKIKTADYVEPEQSWYEYIYEYIWGPIERPVEHYRPNLDNNITSTYQEPK